MSTSYQAISHLCHICPSILQLRLHIVSTSECLLHVHQHVMTSYINAKSAGDSFGILSAICRRIYPPWIEVVLIREKFMSSVLANLCNRHAGPRATFGASYRNLLPVLAIIQSRRPLPAWSSGPCALQTMSNARPRAFVLPFSNSGVSSGGHLKFLETVIDLVRFCFLRRCFEKCSV